MGFKLIAIAQHSVQPRGDIRTLLRPYVSGGARFGTSLLSLGKMDSDDYEDFAVGAPHENNGEGVVFIYRGSKDFWAKESWIRNTPGFHIIIYY